ncbi:hypothetical protein Q1695_004007 [Nippostrongylus brasiliensis]|nr:hypothetical protein Q1695_004007 [Nippostrongylus brasiliensis]
MHSLLRFVAFFALIWYQFSMAEDAVKPKCGGPPPPADTGSITQTGDPIFSEGGQRDRLSAEANPAMAVINSSPTEATGSGSYRARVNRQRLRAWKAKLARKFRRRFAH